MSVFAPPERPVGLPKGTTDAVLERLFPTPNPYEQDPEGWARDVLRVSWWSKQREIAASVRDNRHTAVRSAHATGKSKSSADLACWWEEIWPVGDAIVVSTAPTHDQVDAILWEEIRANHHAAELRGRITRECRWYVGANDLLVAFGRKPAERAAFQGIHRKRVLVIIDEAGGVPSWVFEAVETIATGENDRILAIGNPDDPASEFAEVCKPGKGWNVIKVSAFDTPAFTGEPFDETIPLVSREWVEQRKARWGEASPLYQSKVLAEFPDVSDDTLFPPKLIRRAMDTELDGLERGGYGVDWARYGDAETVVYRNRGGVIRLVASARQMDTHESADLVEGILARHGADRIPAVSDAVGLGAGPTDTLRHRGYAVIAFNGGEKPYDEELFANRRAEVFWTLREEMEAGRIDLDPNDDQLLSQLGSLKWKLNRRGRILIESKEDMRLRGMPSPDRADAASMAFAAPAKPIDPEPQPEPIRTLTHDLLERPM